MRTIYRLTSVLLLFVFSAFFTVYAGTNNSEAEYRKLSETYTLNPDGSQEYRYYMELSLFTHTAMNRTYGESFIIYNPEYQELKIHNSYTVQKDGKIIKTPENAFVEVLPSQAADAPAYNHLKEMVVVHTGLELGATIYLDYSLISKPGYTPELDVCIPVKRTSPIKNYTVTISVPDSKPLYYSLTNNKVKPSVKTVNGTKQVTWTINNVEAASREPGSSGIAGDLYFLTATSYPSVKDALSYLNTQFFQNNSTELSNLASDITKGKNTDTEKLQAILNYIVDNLAFSRLTIQETGFRIRPVKDVLNSMYGTEAEKINLLADLLNVSGIKTEIVAAFHRNIHELSYGLNSIHEIFIIAETGGKRYYINPKTKNMADAAWYPGYAGYISISNPGKSLSIDQPSTALDFSFDIMLSPDKAEIKASGKTGSAFISYTVNNSTSNFSITIPLQNNNGYIILTLPDVADGNLRTYKDYNSKRKENLLLPYMADEKTIYTINVPGNMKLVTTEYKKVINNSVGNLEISVKQNGGKIEIISNFKINKQLITPADYKNFKELITERGGIKMLFNVI